MKLKLKNFQSITQSELTFPTGITLIRGANASGKSAIYRAVKAILTNPNGSKHYVKHGAKEAEVTLENNGNSLTWVRTKSSVAYKHNDQEYLKASKAKASDYCDLGFYTNEKGKLVNMLDEWDVLFPFGESDTELFKIFEDIFNISDSAKVVDTMKADENACTKEMLDCENSIKLSEEKIQSIDNLFSMFPKEQPKIMQQVLSNKAIELEKLRESLIIIHNAKAIPEFSLEPLSLNDYLDEIRAYNTLSEKLSLLRSLLSLPSENLATFQSDDLVNTFKQIADMRKDLSQAKEGLAVATESLRELEDLTSKLQAVEQRLAEVDTCPLCGQLLRKE